MILAPQGHLVFDLIPEEKKETESIAKSTLQKVSIKATVVHIGAPRLTTEKPPEFNVGDTIFLDKDTPFISVEGKKICRYAAVIAYKKK